MSMVKVGDLVQSNMWYPRRKAWDEKRTGLVVSKKYKDGFILGFEVMWIDNHRIEWESGAKMNQGSRWTKVINENR
jgi:hypothetical protein